MTLLTLAGLAVGAAFGGAVVLLAAVIMGWQPKRGPIQRIRGWWDRPSGRRMAYSIGAAVVVAVVTRWPVAAVAAGAAVFAWPALFGAGRDSARQIEKIEALVTWTESLRDTIQGAVSLEQAIPRSIDAAAPAIREPLQRMVALVQHRVPLPLALARFGKELADPTAEQVVASLSESAASKLQSEAMAAAVRDARRNAETIAAAADLRVRGIHSVHTAFPAAGGYLQELRIDGANMGSFLQLRKKFTVETGKEEIEISAAVIGEFCVE